MKDAWAVSTHTGVIDDPFWKIQPCTLNGSLGDVIGALIDSEYGFVTTMDVFRHSENMKEFFEDLGIHVKDLMRLCHATYVGDLDG